MSTQYEYGSIQVSDMRFSQNKDKGIGLVEKESNLRDTTNLKIKVRKLIITNIT